MTSHIPDIPDIPLWGKTGVILSIPYYLLDKNSSDKIVEILARCQKFCPTKYFVRRKFCPTKFCPIRYYCRDILINRKVYLTCSYSTRDYYQLDNVHICCKISKRRIHHKTRFTSSVVKVLFVWALRIAHI